jgi:predicted CXXCH cytochrome family protein
MVCCEDARMALLEIALFLALAAVGSWVAWQSGLALVRALSVLGLLATAAAALTARDRAARLERSPPIAIEHGRSGTVGSGACRSCHPSEYSSWHQSFHRTMTQLATPSSVLGPWNGVKLEIAGRSIELTQRDGALFARLPDPDLVAAANRAGVPGAAAAASLVTRRVLLTTGSHHQQVYWVGGERGNELRLLPISYLIADKRYVARRDAFLQPPDAAPHAIRWNSNCIQCHATRGEPRLDEASDRFASAATELGIACEACHGPGAEHVEKQASPLTRFTSHLTHAPDPSIVNPARLTPERASDVCGQCHAYFVPRDEDRFWHTGFRDFHPGDELERTRSLLAPEAKPAAGGPSIDAAIESLFWDDGTIRVGGREYSGLVRSACYLKGHGERQISCLSCHAMHASDPDDQLRRGQAVDAACTRCHANEGARVAEHTHHAPDSAGSSCVACHMPYTSYALFTAIRSHRIDSPSALATATTGRPNACNLCHLDRTLAWTDETLTEWYGARTSSTPIDDELARRRSVALASTNARAVEELLAGDAATRAVVAAAFGRHAGERAPSDAWRARLLAELAVDPYAAVRKVTCDALERLPDFARLPCDFTGEPDTRRATRAAIVQHAKQLVESEGAPWIHDARDQTSDERIHALVLARDEHPTTISE